MQNKIDNGPYREFKNNPLQEMVKRVNNTLEACKDLLGDNKSKLKESNPSVPRIKGLPKIHKPGQEMREIVAAETAPTQRLAKWLVKEFTTIIGEDQGHTIKNSKEFTQKVLESGPISEDEEMESFDVKALFPSIPVKEALAILEEELLKKKTVKEVKSYMKLARTCMDESYFTFRGKYYKQTKGAPMGNPLSPFLSELFMKKLEQKLEEKGVLPRVWLRYVDDIFAIIKKSQLKFILEEINKIHRRQCYHEG
jgi:hypothetical protein